MSRLVRIPASETVPASLVWMNNCLVGSIRTSVQTTAASDGYLERVAKYVPGEVLAFFIVINAILDQVVQTSGKGALMAGIPVMIGGAGRVLRVHDPGAAVRLVCARERRRLGDQRRRLHGGVSVLGLRARRHRLCRPLGRQPRRHHAGDLHGRERADLAAHEQAGTRGSGPSACRRGPSAPHLDLVGPGPCARRSFRWSFRRLAAIAARLRMPCGIDDNGERSDDPCLQLRAGRPHRPPRGRGGAPGRALRLRRRRRVLSLQRP